MISIVIRTLNEAKYLPDLLLGIKSQRVAGEDIEVIVVDSGSTDGTVDIAIQHGCRVINILKSEFTFGRSLNIGCEASNGEYLVFVSGHCIPVDENWLSELIAPLKNGLASYTYGRQIGGDQTRFSEHQIFSKYFPEDASLAQKGFFCNNANAAILSDAWREYQFDEELTGLEDMELAKRLVLAGYNIAYAEKASVYHLHEETWAQVKRRYEREAIALQKIMPEVHVYFFDFVRYALSAIALDFAAAARQRQLAQRASEILAFRFMQFFGTYRGNQMHRQLSRAMKERYFYPDRRISTRTPVHQLSRTPSNVK